tara:strand:- start:159 stop:368 length:210 start_codon:yes stop_codon:yes gene_type:complete
MSQNKVIIKHLKKHRTINPLQALNLYGCFRLAARISDIRDMGYTINTQYEHDKRTNKVYACYILDQRHA